MFRIELALAVLAIAIASMACTGGGDERQTAPLPTAYPRPAALADSSVEVSAGPVSMRVSASAKVVAQKANALDIAYSPYNSTLYLATNPGVANLAREVDNRTQRMAMNLQGAGAVQTDIDLPAGHAVVVRATSTVQTPVQFVAVDTVHSTIVSGAWFMHDWSQATPYDSVRPVADILEREAITILQSISYDGH